jgi:hypothetical protein
MADIPLNNKINRIEFGSRLQTFFQEVLRFDIKLFLIIL